jgi:hypothetical protein
MKITVVNIAQFAVIVTDDDGELITRMDADGGVFRLRDEWYALMGPNTYPPSMDQYHLFRLELVASSVGR